jgi:predicted Ser/Thr protein kinase
LTSVAAAAAPDIAQTRFILPADAKVLPVAELSTRVRARIGVEGKEQWVVARQGFRMTTRLVPQPLADLLGEFRTASRLTDGVLRFADAQGQPPQTVLEAAFDALATLVDARLLLPEDSPESGVSGPSLIAGEDFAGFEIEAPVRSLDDSEVFRARAPDGETVALKVARETRPTIASMLAHEAGMLKRLSGGDVPTLVAHGEQDGRAFVAMSWVGGVSIGTAAQALRAARNRPRLHDLVARMLHAYGRLHARGLLHGDIHPGNCLVSDDGAVVILDFGHAKVAGPSEDATDIARAGIPQFYDPQMAQARLAARLTPAASAASEQFAIAVLAYLLLTGLHPVDAAAVQEELLRRIATRSPLPFAARGVPSWPGVERVLRRALAHDPQDRFADMATMAKAFDSARDEEPTSGLYRNRGASGRALAVATAAVRRLEVGTRWRRDWVWFALRAALALDDAELLAAADLMASRAGRGLVACVVRAKLAQARSDARAEGRAIGEFVAAVRELEVGRPLLQALRASAVVLDGASPRCAEAGELAGWAGRQVRRAIIRPRRGEAVEPELEARALNSVLALARNGSVAVPAGVQARLRAFQRAGRGDVWVWAAAHDVFADESYRTQALECALPVNPWVRSLALLRRYQLTGAVQWSVDARRSAAQASTIGLPEVALAAMAAELRMPESAMLPPWSALFGLRLP